MRMRWSSLPYFYSTTSFMLLFWHNKNYGWGFSHKWNPLCSTKVREVKLKVYDYHGRIFLISMCKFFQMCQMKFFDMATNLFKCTHEVNIRQDAVVDRLCTKESSLKCSSNILRTRVVLSAKKENEF